MLFFPFFKLFQKILTKTQSESQMVCPAIPKILFQKYFFEKVNFVKGTNTQHAKN